MSWSAGWPSRRPGPSTNPVPISDRIVPLKDPKQPINLTNPIQRGIEHIQHSVDRTRHARPYFRFNLTQPPIWSRHEAADVPHTTGRSFLHALNLCRPITDLPDDAELLDGLRQQIFSSCDHDDGFAWDDMAHEPCPHNGLHASPARSPAGPTRGVGYFP